LLARSELIAAGFNRPAHILDTRSIIVPAALVESCWLRIDSARDSKLLCWDLRTPIGDGPNFETTSLNRGSILTILRAIC
jgi:hypothetical protein